MVPVSRCPAAYMILELLTLSLNLTRFTKDRGIGDQKHLNMHRKVKVLIARWLSSRMETRTRRLRRALRDPLMLKQGGGAIVNKAPGTASVCPVAAQYPTG